MQFDYNKFKEVGESYEALRLSEHSKRCYKADGEAISLKPGFHYPS